MGVAPSIVPCSGPGGLWLSRFHSTTSGGVSRSPGDAIVSDAEACLLHLATDLSGDALQGVHVHVRVPALEGVDDVAFAEDVRFDVQPARTPF